MRNKIVASIASLFVLLGVASVVYSHCHNNVSCERVVRDIVGRYYWEEPYNNTVLYKVNPTKPNMPSLNPDMTQAAALWTNILYDDGDNPPHRIPFNPTFDGTTDADSDVDDDVNVVAWHNLGNHHTSPLAYRHIVERSGNRFLEIDISFNYYKDWKNHGNPDTTKNCLKNVAAHEFGHFAGLAHSSSAVCSAYAEYTMNSQIATLNEHKKESLECEDIWALNYKYEDD